MAAVPAAMGMLHMLRELNGPYFNGPFNGPYAGCVF
jgi:hypothetical protein